VGKMSFGRLVLAVLALALLAAPPAQAEEVTRESYKEVVEPVCKSNAKANERILKGVRGKFRSGKLKAASRQFFRAAAALRRTLRQLRAVSQPPADKAKLAKWLKYIGIEANLFQKTGKKLKAGNRNAATAMVIRLERNANLANNQVIGFEFRHCRFEPSKFT